MEGPNQSSSAAFASFALTALNVAVPAKTAAAGTPSRKALLRVSRAEAPVSLGLRIMMQG
ncbi:hypothetical protein GCM10028833_16220 [Glycomyces tarimensis]